MQTDNKTANLRRPNRKLVEQLRSLRSRLVRLENNSQTQNQNQETTSTNQSYLRTIFDNVSDVISYVDTNGIILDVNKRVEDILGYTPAELIGKNFAEIGIIQPQDLNRVNADFEQSIKTAIPPENYELQLIHKNKKKVDVEIDTSFIWNNGKIEHILSIFRDITEQKNIEEALERGNSQLKNIIALNPYAIGIYDPQGHYVDGNKAFLDLFKCQPPKEYSIFDDPIIEGTGLLDQINIKIKSGLPIQLPEIWYNPHDLAPGLADKLICFRATIFPILTPERKIENIIMMFKDITERKKAEQALQQSEEKYRTFVKNFQGIAYKGDINTWTPLFFNGAVEQTTGYKEEDFIAGKPRWDQIIHPDDLPNLPGKEEIASTPNYSVEREYRIIRKDGKIRWVRELIQNLNDEFDRPSIVQGAIYDITERKISEDEIRRQNKFLKTIMESLDHPFYVIDANDYTVKMANSAAAAGPLSKEVKCYSLTHRRNTPCCETDHRCPLAEVKRNKKPAIVEHIHYDNQNNPRQYEVHAYPIFDDKAEVVQIIEYCLDITERKKAEEKLRKQQAELGRLWHINTAGEMASGLAHELNQPLCAIANYSSGCLRRMVAKNPPIKSNVDINNTIQVTVTDNGKGISAETIGKISDPFFTTKPTGLGIGLSLSRSIIESHGGKLQATPNPDSGVSFSSTLPTKGK